MEWSTGERKAHRMEIAAVTDRRYARRNFQFPNLLGLSHSRLMAGA
jgi:hypothetical protein